MSNAVIEVENISKQYRLGVVSSKTLSDDLKRWIYRLSGKQNPLALVGEENDRTVEAVSDYVWALKNIDFTVGPGEVLGIIGRNGAGKSTLLKILSRVTTPTTGEIRIKGRMASLLEVGTGFHPELTGRENVFLNGAILGMTKSEIKKKFDEIVEFSGVARYVDTPVKRYSSGMYVRLAFAVAAHLEPEILVIDEVLAVGDSEFQKKCLGKMKEVSGGGRTVLFVSHNMGAVSDICDNAILIEKGTKVNQGPAESVIKDYVNSMLKLDLSSFESLNDKKFRRGNGEVRVTNVTIQNIDKEADNNEFEPGDNVRFVFDIFAYENINELYFRIALRSSLSREIITSTERVFVGKMGKNESRSIEIVLPSINLSPGVYETYYWLGSHMRENPYDILDNLTPPLIIRQPLGSLLLSSGYFKLEHKLINR